MHDRLWIDRLRNEAPRILGEADDALGNAEARMLKHFPRAEGLVWECRPETLEFTYVSPWVGEVCGFPAERWLEAGFWAKCVVHLDDQNDALTFCALATASRKDHDFEYRVRTASGQVRWFHDFVRVYPGSRGIPSKLRGFMVDITLLKEQEGESARPPWRRHPAELPRTP